jgi:DNA repair protein RadC
MTDKPEPHFVGHRKRLRERFMVAPPTSFSEYELLEMMLFWSNPRKDVKPLSKLLLKEFGGLTAVINAPRDKLLLIDGVTDMTCSNFALMHELVSRMLQGDVLKKNVLSSWSALLDYLKVTMGNTKTEQFRTLFLNKKNIVIADELQTLGTVDQTPVYPREVVKRILFHEASAIILVHNHPSGNPAPSRADIELTKSIADACKAIGASVHDHVIIAGDEYYSFKSNLLL